MKVNKLSVFQCFRFSCYRVTDVSKFKAVKCAINFISPCKLVFAIYLYSYIQRNLVPRYINAQVKMRA